VCVCVCVCVWVGGGCARRFEAGRQPLQSRPWRGPPAHAVLDQRVMSLVRTALFVGRMRA
jgi:hypothetical protein